MYSKDVLHQVKCSGYNNTHILWLENKFTELLILSGHVDNGIIDT